MSYCHKGLKVTNIDNNFSEDDINFTLDSCEQNCNKYYQCDTVAFMHDKLKELTGKLLRCPYCNKLFEPCDCPDLFYPDADNTAGLNNQLKLLEELQSKGYNIVTCGECGQVFIHRT